MEIVKIVPAGPMPLFTQYHLLMALLLLREREPMGRKNLSESMELGEGSIRSLLKRLIREGLVTTERRGNLLTPAGKELLERTGVIVVPIDGGALSVGSVDVGVLVPAAADNISDGFSQRDAAVRAGAMGATTLVMNGGKLVFPLEGRPLENGSILDQLQGLPRWPLKEKDVIIIGTDSNHIGAEKGALAAAVEIL